MSDNEIFFMNDRARRIDEMLSEVARLAKEVADVPLGFPNGSQGIRPGIRNLGLDTHRYGSTVDTMDTLRRVLVSDLVRCQSVLSALRTRVDSILDAARPH